MNGADMSLPAAARVFVVFLLSVSVIQGQDGWRVTYTPLHICALKGSTVNIGCTYRYPPRGNDGDTTVERTLWFTKLQDKDPVDLRADPEYAGRVKYSYRSNICTLTITDLRESDSAEYKFMFITSRPDRSFTDEPGVKLSVTGLQVQISGLSCKHSSCTGTRAELRCISSCSLPYRSSYIWYKNGQRTQEQTSWNSKFNPKDSVSCALKQHLSFPSPSVCVGGQSCNRVIYTERSICAFKGSSVNISCTYLNSGYITSKFWFSPERNNYWLYRSQPEDLTKDYKYSDRVRVFETESGRSTLRITNLRQSDSAQYRFKFKPNFEWWSSLPATTLTVTDPDLQVQVIWSPAGPKLVCHSTCLLTGRSSFVWFKNQREIKDETSPSYGGNVNLADSYSCAYEGYHSTPVYAPKVSLVLMNPPGDIMEGSSVTLMCSSDANPPAKSTWYKENQKLLSKQPQQLFLSSVQSSDSGRYFCAAENELGRTSENVFIDVKYAPKLPSVSVSPSAEIMEGSSVTLNCSSDANPAANYTWYKKNQTLLPEPEGIYHFTSIRSEDSGNYYCRAENEYDQINSTSLNLDVQYAPKLPSVSVSPSAEIMEGSSVNLTCSSDANPAANYTWYKENGDSPAASGPIFTITDFRAEHSGNYYCEAQNTRGCQNSTLYLTVAGAWRSGALRITTSVLLVLILLAVFLWIGRKKCITQRSNSGEKTDNRAELNVGPVYDTAEQRDDLHYSSVRFIQNQEDCLYSNVGSARPHRPTEEEEEEEEDGVEYTAVKADGDSRAPQTRCQEDGEDSFTLYSTVQK